MGKGALSGVAFYIFLSITTGTDGWKQRRQLLKINSLDQKEYKGFLQGRGKMKMLGPYP